MQIQVRINEEGALRNQRYAFTNRFTLVCELLQNARRAGATCIEIHYDATSQQLSVLTDRAPSTVRSELPSPVALTVSQRSSPARSLTAAL